VSTEKAAGSWTPCRRRSWRGLLRLPAQQRRQFEVVRLEWSGGPATELGHVERLPIVAQVAGVDGEPRGRAV
jgi:hypothetical protein